MAHGRTSRAPTRALALVAALLAAWAFHRWTATHKPQRPTPGAATWQPTPTRSALLAPTPLISAPTPHGAAKSDVVGREPPAVPSPSDARPTPRVFDFANLARPETTPGSGAEKRFETNERFTEDDLRHPERYFDVAARMPELNRPEERHDTLEFFLAYREKLGRDLDTMRNDSDAYRETLAVIERYDRAITRLRALIDAQEAK